MRVEMGKEIETFLFSFLKTTTTATKPKGQKYRASWAAESSFRVRESDLRPVVRDAKLGKFKGRPQLDICIRPSLQI